MAADEQAPERRLRKYIQKKNLQKDFRETKLVCALPMWNAEHIGWLAMESLCNQKDVDFDWELIIIEDKGRNFFGSDRVFSYNKRLAQAGCVSIDYQFSNQRIPLARKWKLMAERALNPESDFLLVAADCYSQPYRLAETHKILQNDEWVNSPLV